VKYSVEEADEDRNEVGVDMGNHCGDYCVKTEGGNFPSIDQLRWGLLLPIWIGRMEG